MAKRTDNNHGDIVDVLRRMGAFVCSLHTVGRGCPDLLIGYRGKWRVAEIKNGKLGWRLTPAQKKFRATCNANVTILDSVETAVAWLGGGNA